MDPGTLAPMQRPFLRALLVLIFAVCLAAPSAALGAVSGTMTVDHIGSGSDKSIKVFSVVQEVTVPVSSGGKTIGRRQHKALKVVAQIDRAYPQLFQAATTNKNLGNVELAMSQGSLGTLSIKLRSARLVGVRAISNAPINGIQKKSDTVEYTFVFDKIEVRFKDAVGSDSWSSSKGT